MDQLIVLNWLMWKKPFTRDMTMSFGHCIYIKAIPWIWEGRYREVGGAC